MKLRRLYPALAACLVCMSVSAAEPAGPHVVFDTGQLDPDVSACSDFNGFANGKWLAANPVPVDQSDWSAFRALQEQTLVAQRQLVDKANAEVDHAPAGSIEQKIGWMYRSGMDEATVDKAGFDPIKPDLAAIAALRTPSDVVHWLRNAYASGAAEGLEDLGFKFDVDADQHDATRQIGYAKQGGLGMWVRDFYTTEDAAGMRKAYLDYIAQSFVLTGVSAAQAHAKAEGILAFETRLAKVSLSPVELRDPQNQYHFVSIAQADAVMPHFGWGAFFKALDIPVGQGFSLSQPKFFTEFDRMLAEVPVAQWRDYLAFHTIANASQFLSKPFTQAQFAFYGHTMNGIQEDSPRWKNLFYFVLSDNMGEALGQLYVAAYFPPQAKARAQVLVANIGDALKNRIEHLDWMSDTTKQKALEKWSSFLPKIGYPDHWRSWDGLVIKPDDFYGNVRAAKAFNYRYKLDHIGKPTDRLEWAMAPQTINAYYDQSTNTINFPAAILQPPFFYPDGDDAINYGAIGAVIGHEFSHGFDDKGSQFDGHGNKVNWWTQADRDQFNARADKLVAQFNDYVPMANHPDKHVNGRLTVGENIGDLGGLNIAHDALQTALAANPAEARSKIDGYTQDQRFFLSWARIWHTNVHDESQLMMLINDPHSPGKFRAIDAPSNMPAFAAAFQCKAGDPMVRAPDKQVVIW